jgi:maleate isomerase
VLGDAAVGAAISDGRPGVPVVTPTAAAGRALTALGARRISLLTPYLVETTLPVVACFEAAGFEIVRTLCLGLPDDRMMARVDKATIRRAAREADHPEAEAVFISCTALPALEAAHAIEADLGKPVVTSNLASIRELRTLAGLREPVAGYGRVLNLASDPVPA